MSYHHYEKCDDKKTTGIFLDADNLKECEKKAIQVMALGYTWTPTSENPCTIIDGGSLWIENKGSKSFFLHKKIKNYKDIYDFPRILLEVLFLVFVCWFFFK